MTVRRRAIAAAAAACGLVLLGNAAYTDAIDTHAVDNTVLGYSSVQVTGGVLLGLNYTYTGANLTSVEIFIQDDFTTPQSRVTVVPNNGSESTCTIVTGFGVNGYDSDSNRTKLTCAMPVPIATTSSLAFTVLKET